MRSGGNIELIRQFSEDSFSRNVDTLNSIVNNISLSNNMNGQIIDNIELPVSGDEIAISHNLKLTPKYRIILRQSGDSVVIDGDTEWNDKTIYLKLGNITSDVTISILLMRE